MFRVKLYLTGISSFILPGIGQDSSPSTYEVSYFIIKNLAVVLTKEWIRAKEALLKEKIIKYPLLRKRMQTFEVICSNQHIHLLNKSFHFMTVHVSLRKYLWSLLESTLNNGNEICFYNKIAIKYFMPYYVNIY